ncbi:hypothetical protein Acr_00g0072690 [Actinidia rufa]|uniref:Uncharacterized protein n=1 Tax=Actinidia rufa TaxID=165716 RepID=A0A7J0DRX4_9ERIC|nr:hypothetical protein Acr_00g0072690 [Actinidia rufa]
MESNTMSKDDLDRLKKSYSFPTGVQTRIPEEGETILSTRTCDVTFYKSCFPHRSEVPNSSHHQDDFEFLQHLPCPTFPQCVISVLVIWRFIGVIFFLNEFRYLFTLFKSPRSDLEWLYFKARLVQGEGVPQVPRSWGTLEISSSGGDHAKDKLVEEKRLAPWATRSGCSSSSSSLSSGAMSESWLPADQIRWDVKNNQSKEARPKGGGRQGYELGFKVHPAAKGVVIGEKHPREKASNVSQSEVKSKGNETLPRRQGRQNRQLCSDPPSLYDARTQGMRPHSILPVWSRPRWKWFEPITGPLSWKGFLLRPPRRRRKLAKELKTKSDALARLEEEVAKMKKNEALAKKKAVEKYQALEEFHEAVKNVSSKYFGEGFDFCKIQLARHHPSRHRFGRNRPRP